MICLLIPLLCRSIVSLNGQLARTGRKAYEKWFFVRKLTLFWFWNTTLAYKEDGKWFLYGRHFREFRHWPSGHEQAIIEGMLDRLDLASRMQDQITNRASILRNSGKATQKWIWSNPFYCSIFSESMIVHCHFGYIMKIDIHNIGRLTGASEQRIALICKQIFITIVNRFRGH